MERARLLWRYGVDMVLMLFLFLFYFWLLFWLRILAGFGLTDSLIPLISA